MVCAPTPRENKLIRSPCLHAVPYVLRVVRFDIIIILYYTLLIDSIGKDERIIIK